MKGKMKTLGLLFMAVLMFAAVPAAAQADQWFEDPGDVLIGETREEGHEVEFSGELTSIEQGVESGPCPVTAHSIFWNEEGVGVGETTAFHIDTTPPCPVSFMGIPLPGCEVVNATNNTEPVHGGQTWPVRTETEGAENFDSQDVEFVNEYSKGCEEVLPIPPGPPIPAAGTVTGFFNNDDGCIEFDNSGDLKDVNGNDVNITGGVCGPEETLTLN